jgi:hypothetical protein
MAGNYKELKYLILWGLIYLIIVYGIRDTIIKSKNVIIIATILTALIYIIDMLFLNITTVIPNVEKMTTINDDDNCLDAYETKKYIDTYLKKIRKFFKTSDNVIDKWHDTFNLPNVNDTKLSEILDEYNDDIHDLERHPPSTFEHNFEPGSSVFHPQDWYQKSGAFFKPSTNNCTRSPIYIDSTTANLKNFNEALIPQNTFLVQRIINHVKNRYNTL